MVVEWGKNALFSDKKKAPPPILSTPIQSTTMFRTFRLQIENGNFHHHFRFVSAFPLISVDTTEVANKLAIVRLDPLVGV